MFWARATKSISAPLSSYIIIVDGGGRLKG